MSAFPPVNEAARAGFVKLCEMYAPINQSINTSANQTINAAVLGRSSVGVLATGGSDQTINLWKIGRSKPITSLLGHTTEIDSIAFSVNETQCAAGSRGGSLRVWDLTSNQSIKQSKLSSGHKSCVTCLDFHPFGDVLSSGSTDCSIKVWDLRAKGVAGTYKGHTQPIQRVIHSPDGRWAVSGDTKGSVRVWDLTAGKCVSELYSARSQVGSSSEARYEKVSGLAFHPCEFLLAVSGEKSIMFYDMESFDCVSQTSREAHPINAIAFDPEGAALLSAQSDSLRVWGWEPPTCHDSLDCSWPDLCDMAVSSRQELVTLSKKGNVVTVHMCDLPPLKPYNQAHLSNNQPINHIDEQETQRFPADLPSSTPAKKSVSSILTTPNTAFFKAHAGPMTVATPSNVPTKQSILQSNSQSNPSHTNHQSNSSSVQQPSSKSINHSNQGSGDSSPTSQSPRFAAPVYQPTIPPAAQPTSQSINPSNSQTTSEVNNQSSNQATTPQPVKPQPLNPSISYTNQAVQAYNPITHQPINHNVITPSVSTQSTTKAPVATKPSWPFKAKAAVEQKSSSPPPSIIQPVVSSSPITPVVSQATSQITNQLTSLSINQQSNYQTPDKPTDEADYQTPRNNQSHNPVLQPIIPPVNQLTSPAVNHSMLSSPRTADHTSNNQSINQHAPVSPNSTLIPAQPSHPLNLSLSSFLPPPMIEEPVDDQSLDAELESVSQTITGSHATMLTVLDARRSALNSLIDPWSQGFVKQTISALGMIRDPITANDFLTACESSMEKGSLTLELAVDLLPIINQTLFTSRYESCLSTAMRYTRMCSISFGPLIKDVRQSMNQMASGVDLQREERIERCQACHTQLAIIHSNMLPKIMQRSEARLASMARELQAVLQNIVQI